jgi:hypothetical protein
MPRDHVQSRVASKNNNLVSPDATHGCVVHKLYPCGTFKKYLYTKENYLLYKFTQTKTNPGQILCSLEI